MKYYFFLFLLMTVESFGFFEDDSLTVSLSTGITKDITPKYELTIKEFLFPKKEIYARVAVANYSTLLKFENENLDLHHLGLFLDFGYTPKENSLNYTLRLEMARADWLTDKGESILLDGRESDYYALNSVFSAWFIMNYNYQLNDFINLVFLGEYGFHSTQINFQRPKTSLNAVFVDIKGDGNFYYSHIINLGISLEFIL